MSKGEEKYSILRKLFDKSSPLYGIRLALSASVIYACAGLAAGYFSVSLSARALGWIYVADTVYALLFYNSLKQSIRSPELFYNYGYGKYENLGGVLYVIILIALLGHTIHASLVENLSFQSFDIFYILILYTAAAFAVSLLLAIKESKRADWLHLNSLRRFANLKKYDSYSRLAALAAFVICAVFVKSGNPDLARDADFISAILIIALAAAPFVFKTREALNQLLDRNLPEEIHFDIISIISENVGNMCEFKTIHSRKSGSDLFIEIDIVMPYDMPLEECYKLEQNISWAIAEKYPEAKPRLYMKPCPKDCVYNGASYCPVKESINNKKKDRN